MSLVLPVTVIECPPTVIVAVELCNKEDAVRFCELEPKSILMDCDDAPAVLAQMCVDGTTVVLV